MVSGLDNHTVECRNIRLEQACKCCIWLMKVYVFFLLLSFFNSAFNQFFKVYQKYTWYSSCMQCPLFINTIMSVWMNTCGSCLSENKLVLSHTHVCFFGYKTIHTFIVYGTTILFNILCASTHLWAGFPIVQGRQQWTLFLCTVWDSLTHHIAFMSLPRRGLSRERGKKMTQRVGWGSSRNGDVKH